MGKKYYNIIRTLLERFILPKYPFLKLKEIDSYVFSFRGDHNIQFSIRFIVPKKIPMDIQEEIDTEVQSLFKLSNLDKIDENTTGEINIWFKTPREKEFSFHFSPEYKLKRQ